MQEQKIPIERRDGVTLYGRIVGPGGKLGRYGVYSDFLGDNGQIYHTYAEAHNRFNAVIGIQKK